MGNKQYIGISEFSELSKMVHTVKKKVGYTGSLLNYLNKKQNKNKQKFYLTSSFNRSEIDLSDIEIETLISKKLLKFLSKKEQKIVPTFKAFMIVDYQIYNPNPQVEKLLDDLNKLYFEKILKLSEEPIDTKEMAIIITLLGLGAISETYALKLTEKNASYFKEAVDIAVKFVKSLGKEYEDGKVESLWRKNVTGEGPILGEMRRLNKISIHTENIYRNKAREGAHYLDLIEDNRLNDYRLTYLLKKLFERKTLSYQQRLKLIETLDKIEKFEFNLFKDGPEFDMFNYRKRLKIIIESKI